MLKGSSSWARKAIRCSRVSSSRENGAGAVELEGSMTGGDVGAVSSTSAMPSNVISGVAIIRPAFDRKRTLITPFDSDECTYAGGSCTSNDAEFPSLALRSNSASVSRV